MVIRAARRLAVTRRSCGADPRGARVRDDRRRLARHRPVRGASDTSGAARRLPERAGGRGQRVRPAGVMPTPPAAVEDRLMSTLVAIAYPDQATAEEVVATLSRLQTEHLIALEDAVV